MKSRKFPYWKGFEISPDGCLLEQIIDLSTSMGIAYERSCGFYKDFHVHERMMFVFPRANCRMEIKEKKSQNIHKIDSESVLIVPHSIEHDDLGLSSIYDTFALYPSDEIISIIGKKEGLTGKKIEHLNSGIRKLSRNVWLDQLVQQYFFQRLIAKRNDQLPFLEENIVAEIFKLVFEINYGGQTEIKLVSQDEGVAERAIRYIETNLFHELTLDDIAKNSNASISTLLRQFKGTFEKTPYRYIKERRMLEALNLLMAGHHTVAEVAVLVGYQNISAFSEAFRSLHRKPPSHFIKKL